MSLSHMPLEDDVCDVIGKAMHGLGLSLAQLAKITNLPEGDINAALQANTTIVYSNR